MAQAHYPTEVTTGFASAVAAQYGTGENGGLFVIRLDGYIASRSDQR